MPAGTSDTRGSSRGSTPRSTGANGRGLPVSGCVSISTWVWTYGATARTAALEEIVAATRRQSDSGLPMASTRRCALKPRMRSRNCSPKPVITAITIISTATPRVTPSTQINVMIDTNVRLGRR